LGNLLTLLPLAFVMVAGPQIISAIFLATSAGWRRNCAAFVAGAALSISLFVVAAYLIAKGAKDTAGESDEGGASDAINVVVLGLLLFAAVHVFRKRNESEPPKWMGRLQDADAGFSFKLGFLLLGVFPTDIVTSMSVGSKLAADGKPLWQGAGFVVLTLFLLALPALLLLVFGKRAEAFLPKARDWMNTNSWVVSELVIVLFVVITINSLAGG
jgi:hypothetical protein